MTKIFLLKFLFKFFFRRKKILLVLGVIGVLFFGFGSLGVQKLLLQNYSVNSQTKIPQQVADFHQSLLIADMHADTLLWKRDIQKRNNLGHVDIPRLQSGNVALQFFTIVSKVSLFMNMNYTPDFGNFLTPLFIAQRRPFESWFNPMSMVQEQIRDFSEQVKRSNKKLLWVKTKQDLEELLHKRKQDPQISGALLGVEGLMAIEDDYRNIELLYNLGVRMAALTHFQDTVFAGSAHGVKKDDLSPSGKLLLERMQQLNMLVDISHLSEKASLSLLDLAQKPIVISHTGVYGTCSTSRNTVDAILQKVKLNRGVVGIGFFKNALCGKSIADLVNAIAYVRNLIGADYVGLGSDFDGSVSTVFDASQMVLLTRALWEHKAKFSPDEIRKIMGENVIRVLREVLPSNK